MKSDFMEHLKHHWFPILRESGFKGSGKNFHRIKGAFAHCINIQTKSDGKACCVNLGVEPKLQPIRGFSEIVDLDKAKEIDCELRSRLKPADNYDDWWWPFGENKDESIHNAESLIEVWKNRGELFFDDYITLPGRISSVTVADYETSHPRFSPAVFIPTTQKRAILLCARVFWRSKITGRPASSQSMASRYATAPGLN